MSDVDLLKEQATQELLRFIMEDQGLDMEGAMALLCNSSTFAKLLDEETGLYRESPAYTYEFLKEELKGAA